MTEAKPSSASESPKSPKAHENAPEPEKPKSTRKRIIDAVMLNDRAASHGRWAEHKARSGDRIGYLAAKNDADQMHARADADLTRWSYTTRNRQQGNGGELVPLFEPEDAYRRDFKRMMVEDSPDVLEQQASSDAMNLLANVDALPAGLEMANSIKARNRPERMLAHEAATMHTLAMKFAARAAAEIDRAQTHMTSGQTQFRQIASIESCRNLNAAARAMSAFNDAMLTLQKLRTGGRQIVTVQHVTVKDGGQAVVAQTMRPSGKSGGRKRRGRTAKP